MMMIRAFELVGALGGWLFLLSIASSAWMDRRRPRPTGLRSGVPQPVSSDVPVLGLCARCSKPRLPPGMPVPSYLSACTCPPPPAADVMAGQPPRPPIT